MSRFLAKKFANIKPYVPGEQPKDRRYIKLNTNESPYPPSPKAQSLARDVLCYLQLYSDPECKKLTDVTAQYLGVRPDQIVFTNGSDEILNFVFLTFCDENVGVAFPDITYGFYAVYADFYGIDAMKIPLREDFSICADDYIGLNRTIVIANPNAPTGLYLPLRDIERIVKGNPENLVVIDEAYVDFGNESAISLIDQYPNLLICRTFSKSRSMAGARLGFAVGNAEVIRDLNNIRFSTNPFNINAMTMAAGIGSIEDETYFRDNCRKIIDTREWTTAQLRKLNFTVLDSSANFVFAKHADIDGKDLYLKLKDKGILVRHFAGDRLNPFVRITIGTAEEMETTIRAIKEILENVL